MEKLGNIKKLGKLFVFFFIAHFIASCTDPIDEMSAVTEDLNNNGTFENMFTISEEEAKETLASFLDQFEPGSPDGVRSTSQRTIKDIQAFRVNATTRSSSDFGCEIPEGVAFQNQHL